MKRGKRFLALLLAGTMLLSSESVSVLATEQEGLFVASDADVADSLNMTEMLGESEVAEVTEIAVETEFTETTEDAIETELTESIEVTENKLSETAEYPALSLDVENPVIAPAGSSAGDPAGNVYSFTAPEDGFYYFRQIEQEESEYWNDYIIYKDVPGGEVSTNYVQAMEKGDVLYIEATTDAEAEVTFYIGIHKIAGYEYTVQEDGTYIAENESYSLQATLEPGCEYLRGTAVLNGKENAALAEEYLLVTEAEPLVSSYTARTRAIYTWLYESEDYQKEIYNYLLLEQGCEYRICYILQAGDADIPEAVFYGDSIVKTGKASNGYVIYDTDVKETSVIFDIEMINNGNCYYAPTDGSEEEKGIAVYTGWDELKITGLKPGTEYYFTFTNQNAQVLGTVKETTEVVDRELEVEYRLDMSDDCYQWDLTVEVSNCYSAANTAKLCWKYADEMGEYTGSISKSLSEIEAEEEKGKEFIIEYSIFPTVLADTDYDITLWLEIDGVEYEKEEVQLRTPETGLQPENIYFDVCEGTTESNVKYEAWTDSYEIIPINIYYRQQGDFEYELIRSRTLYEGKINEWMPGCTYEFVIFVCGVRIEKTVTVGESTIRITPVGETEVNAFDIVREFKLESTKETEELDDVYQLQMYYLRDGEDYLGQHTEEWIRFGEPIELTKENAYQAAYQTARTDSLFPATEYKVKWVLEEKHENGAYYGRYTLFETFTTEKPAISYELTGNYIDRQIYDAIFDYDSVANFELFYWQTEFYIREQGTENYHMAGEVGFNSNSDARPPYTVLFTDLDAETTYEVSVRYRKSDTETIEYDTFTITTPENTSKIAVDGIVNRYYNGVELSYVLSELDTVYETYISVYVRAKGSDSDWIKGETKKYWKGYENVETGGGNIQIGHDKDTRLKPLTKYEYRIGFGREEDTIEELQNVYCGEFTTYRDSRKVEVNSVNVFEDRAEISYSLSGMGVTQAETEYIHLFMKEKDTEDAWMEVECVCYDSEWDGLFSIYDYNGEALKEDVTYEYRIGFGDVGISADLLEKEAVGEFLAGEEYRIKDYELAYEVKKVTEEQAVLLVRAKENAGDEIVKVVLTLTAENGLTQEQTVYLERESSYADVTTFTNLQPGTEYTVTKAVLSKKEADNWIEIDRKIVENVSFFTKIAYYVTPKLPKIRNQIPYGNCWSFAPIGACEIELMNRDGVESVDLSELHLSYFAYHSVTDPLGGTAGDVTRLVNEGVNDPLNIGGNIDWTVNVLANWVGMAAESKVPYSMGAEVEKNGLSEELAYENLVHLKNVYFLDIVENPELVKAMIQKYGSVAVAYGAVDQYYCEEYNSYYVSDNPGVNHEVLLVGWDDKFPKEHFNVEAPIDGAWLVRNSWGSFGDEYNQSGYFWISYADLSLPISGYACAFDAAIEGQEDFYDNNYQYDGLIWSSGVAGCGSITAANVFTASAAELDMAANVFTASATELGESLEAVMFSTMGRVNQTYKVEVYKGLIDRTIPDSGLLVATETGVCPYSGIYTVELSEPVPLEKGELFSVVVTGVGIDEEETNEAGEYGKWETIASSGAGQSFQGFGGTWQDIGEWGHGNFRIKAFTNNNLPQATTVTARANADGAIELNWEEVDGCTGYHVYRRAAGSKDGELLTMLESGNTQYIDNSAETGVRYYYFVETIYGDKEGEVLKAVSEEAYVIYRISYVLNGGINAANNPTEYCEVKEQFILAEPQYEMAIFEGWYLDEAFERKVTVINPRDYAGNLTLYAKWRMRQELQAEWLIYDEEQEYAQAEIVPEITIKNGDDTLVKDVDYTMSYVNETVDGIKICRVTLTGIGEYFGSQTVIIRQKQISISDVEIAAGKKMTVLYAPDGQKPLPKVVYGQKRLEEGTDFEAVYYRLNEAGERVGIPAAEKQVTDAGIYELVLRGKNNFTGELEKASMITVKARPFSAGAVRIENTFARYDSVSGNITANCKFWYQDVLLEEGKDYTIAEKVRNEDNSVATFVFEGCGNYSGRMTQQFALILSDVIMFSEGLYKITDIENQHYTGEKIEPEISVVKVEDATDVLQKDVDYTVSYKYNLEAGTARVIVTGINKCVGELTKEFVILPAELDDIRETENTSVTTEYGIRADISAKEFTFDGSILKPDVSVTVEGVRLKEGKDYSVSYQKADGTAAAKDVGIYDAVITMQGNYSGTITFAYEILPVALEDVTIRVSEATYTGAEIIPTLDEIQVVINGYTLTNAEKEGLFIKFAENNLNVTNAAVVKITGTGNFTGEVSCNFTILPRNIKDERLEIYLAGQRVAGADTGYRTEWDGTAKTPEVVIKNGEAELVLGRDYALSYRYNTEKGDARVIISGKQNYQGVYILFFEITGIEFSKENGVQVKVEEGDYYYNGADITPEVVVTKGTVTLQEGKDYNIFYTNNRNAGVGKIMLTGAGEYSGTIFKTFTILPKTLEQAETVKVSDIPRQRYTRAVIVPEISIEIDGRTLKTGKDYSVEVQNAVEEGTASIIVTGMGNYGGVLAEKEFEIYKTKITYVLNGGVNSPDNPDCYTAADEIVLAEPKKESHIFVGWYLDKGCTKKASAIQPGSTGDKTFYAKWTPKEVRGIDVSKWQGNIDWNAVKKSGVTFAIIRAGNRYGSSGTIAEDPYFEYNFKSALHAGIKVGVYFYSQAISENEAIEEANYTLTLIKKYRTEYEAEYGKKADLTYPIFIDTEYLDEGRANVLTAEARTACVKAFCKKVEVAGYEAGVYANKDWFIHNLYAGELNDYCIWVAQYPKNYTEGMKSTYTGPHRIWQYTSSGTVSGISGRVDMNICYQDFIKYD
ncbi:MAG: InlB B-repeat-containing protein [Lachnospiraceae bacterium]|nr:InlB B-repeat-containing protein [Lachnospiraceae bacterium]